MGKKDQGTPKVVFTGLSKDHVSRLSSEIAETDRVAEFGIDVVTETGDGLKEVDGNPDCVVVVAVPSEGTDGRGTSPLEKVQETEPGAPVVVFSDGSSVTPKEASEAGATDYVELPLGDRKVFVRQRLRAHAKASQDRRHEESDYTKKESETIFKNAQDPMFLIDVKDGGEVEFTVERLNPAYEKNVGIKADEFEGKTPVDILGEETGQEIHKRYLECYNKRQEMSYEEELEVPRGKRVYQTKLSPIVVDGEVKKLVGNVRDITEQKKRERELREKRTQIRGLLDTVSATIFMKDTEGRYLVMNQKAREAMGIDEDEEIEGLTDHDLFSEEVADEYLTDDRRVFEKEETLEVEEEVPTDDGKRTHLTLKSPIYDDDGELYGLCAVSTDITERKERERELKRRSEAMEASIDGMAILNEDGEYVYVNEAHVDAYGYEDEDEDELLGESWRILYREEELKRIAEEVMPTFFEQGKWRGEATGLCSDGTEFPQELSLTSLEDGGIVCVVRDITERKEYESELKRYKTFVENSSDIITLLDEDGTILYQSPSISEVLGYEQGETIGDSSFNYIHPDDVERVIEKFSQLIDQPGNTLEGVEYRFQATDGSYVWLEAMGVDRTDTEVDGVVVNTRDVTERKKREQKLAEQKEQIEFFNSLLRHDLLNSMTVIRGNADLLLEEIQDDDARRGYVEKILEKSEDIVSLTKRVRSVLSRLTDEEPTELTSRDLSAVLRERLEALKDSYPDVECEMDVPEKSPVTADGFIGDVFDNIFINAVEHNDSEEPRIELDVEQDSDVTTVRIADNGPGIPDEKKEAVLEKGERGSTSSGLGFGLYFVNSMVSEYGGSIEIEDNEPRGTVVTVELPTAKENRKRNPE